MASTWLSHLPHLTVLLIPHAGPHEAMKTAHLRGLTRNNEWESMGKPWFCHWEIQWRFQINTKIGFCPLVFPKTVVYQNCNWETTVFLEKPMEISDFVEFSQF